VFLRALTTVYIAVAAQILGVIVGLIAALMRTSRPAARILSGCGLALPGHAPRSRSSSFFGINLPSASR
jgi:hypothetical protein